MKIGIRKVIVFSVMLLALFIVSACAQGGESGGGQQQTNNPEQGAPSNPSASPSVSNPSDEVKWPEIITIATPNQGSSSYVGATIVADIIKSNTPVRQVVVEPYGNSGNMVRALDEGKADLAFHAGYRVFTDAYYGNEGGWDGPKNVSNLMFGYVDPFGLMVTDPNIKDFTGLKGKAVAVLTTNRDHLNVINAYQDIYNMSEKDVTVLPIQDVASGVSWLNEGRADAFLFTAAPLLQDIKQSKGLWGLPVPPEIAEKIIEAESTRVPYTIPAGESVLAPEADLPYLGLTGGVAVRSDMDENLVYEIVKLIYEKGAKDLYQSKPNSKMNWNVEHASEIATFPFHQGLIKYLEEEGLWTEEDQQKQQKLLR